MGLDVAHLMVKGAPEPIAPFSHATAAGDFIFVTGQMPIVPETGEYRCDGASRRRERGNRSARHQTLSASVR